MAKIKLKQPVEFGDKTITEVDVKETWKAGDYIDIQNGGEGAGDRACRQVAIAINKPDPFVRNLGMEDYLEILQASNKFFPGAK